mgnify:CR=1 FL=1|jgi:hypothetical protein
MYPLSNGSNIPIDSLVNYSYILKWSCVSLVLYFSSVDRFPLIIDISTKSLLLMLLIFINPNTKLTINMLTEIIIYLFIKMVLILSS